MTDSPVKHIDEDGSIYAAEITPPDADAFGGQYQVDLLRSSVDDYGLGREQRLTVGQYDSWGEAEEQLYDLEDKLAENGLAALGEHAQRLREQPYDEDMSYAPANYPPELGDVDNHSAAQLLTARDHESLRQIAGSLPATPLFNPDEGSVRHLDGGGTTHWFAIVETHAPEAEPYELRYFRALETDDGERLSDSYPVMPLPDDDPASAWALPGLEMYLQKGDVYMAQQFAHDVADATGQDFPEPMELPSLDPRPEYYFGYGVGPNNEPSLEAVKTWMDGSERRFDTLTVGEYDSYELAAIDERLLETLLDEQDLQAAMNRAETMAVARGFLDPNRADPRIFFDDDAPPDFFTTNRERELAGPSYTIGAISANGKSFLDITKAWGMDDHEHLVVPQVTWEDARDNAMLANEMLEEDRLQDAMRLIEVAGIESGVIDPKRDDPRLFKQGPPDAFQTIREEEIDEYLARHGVTWRETNEWDSGSAELPQTTEVENPYWRLDTLPVNNPDGKPLGHALHIVVYPGVKCNSEQVGAPHIAEDEPFRMLEMAHFETTDAADKFGEEFSGYLIPGLLEGPELAEEVARLEGLSVEWKTLEGDDLTAYQNLTLTLTHDPADWRPYNPNAEREAVRTAEGLSADPTPPAFAFKGDTAEASAPDLER